MRKEFTVTERLAIAQKIAETLEGRNGIRHDSAPAKEIFPEVAGQTRDLAAKAAGIGSGKTLEAAHGPMVSRYTERRHRTDGDTRTRIGGANPFERTGKADRVPMTIYFCAKLQN